MDDLASPPYNFAEGEKVKARARANNICGSSPNSAVSSPVELKRSPPVMEKPFKQTSTASSITMCWRDHPGQSYRYDLFWSNQGEFAPFQQVGGLRGTCHTLKVDSIGDTYRFYVQARNACGPGPASPHTLVSLADVPDQPQCRTRVQDCNMIVEWDEVSGNGSPVLAYNVQIADGNGQMKYHEACSLSRSLSCSVPMRELAVDYGLEEGDEIKVQISCRNAIGESRVGQCTACNMLSPPGSIITPEIVDNSRPGTTKDISIRWYAATGCSTNTWDSDCRYEITAFEDNRPS